MDANDNPILAFLAATDPGQPPGAAQYVARSNSLQDALDVGLRPMARSRVLLVGQTGIGKSTEIRALIASKLAASHTVLVPPVDQDVDLSVADWTDFLVYAAGFVLTTMGRGIMAKALEEPVLEAVDRLSRALAPREERKIREESQDDPAAGYKSTMAAAFGMPAGPSVRKTIEKTVAVGGPPEPTISQRFRNDTKAVHRQIAGAQAQFWDLAKGVFTALERCTGKPVVVVLDGLEKLSVSAATELFSVRGNLLANWPTRLLVTGPLGMTAEPWFTEAEERLTAVEHLRALPGQAGLEFMMAIAESRRALAVMAEEDVLEQISWSGGIPRQFLQLLTRAAQDAAAAGLGHVPTEFHHRARFRLAQRWQYQLEPDDMKALASPLDQLNKHTRNRLLRVGALIEYDQANGSLTWKINPLVQLLLEATRTESKDNA